LNLDKLFDRLSDVISESDDFLLTTHAFPDGDAMGSMVAVYDVISNLKKMYLWFATVKFHININFFLIPGS